jgi:RimK family alpha-L-glutamate ligase
MRLLVVTHDEIYGIRRLKEEARFLGHEVEAVALRDLSFTVDAQGRRASLHGADVLEGRDCLYLRHFYPYFAETLLLAEMAAGRGISVVERRLAEGHFVQNKMYDYWKLADAGLPVPRVFQTFRAGNAKDLLPGVGAPFVAKGVHGARGRYVFKVERPSDIAENLSDDLVGAFNFQEFLEIEAEYRVIVIGGRAIGAMRKFNPEGDFRHNMSVGAEGEIAVLPAPLLELCERAAVLLGREFAGVDLAIAAGKPYILEVNRRPGFQGFEEVTGLNVAKAFIEYVAQDRDRRPAERRQVHAVPSHH